MEQYIPYLREYGIDLEVAAFFDEDNYRVLYQPDRTWRKISAVLAGCVRRFRDLWRARDFELLFVHRESMPLGPPLIEAFWKRRHPYVFDFDDAIFLGAIHPSNRAWSWLRHPSRVARSVRGAAAVIAGNEYLADWARRLNADVTVIPTPVDTDRHVPRGPHLAKNPTVIGWVGSSTTAPYLHILDQPISRLAADRDLLVRVIGGSYDHPDVHVDVHPYQLTEEAGWLQSFDIGVLPQPDDAWTRGKGAFKALLYMATGVPVVASYGGTNTTVVIDGETGFCVRDSEAWVESLERLAADPSLRQRFGDAGRARVLRQYSLRVLAPRLADVIHRAARRG